MTTVQKKQSLSSLKDMRILITNDDGIDQPGLRILEEAARQFTDDVWIVAPAKQQSAKARSISLHKPILMENRGEKKFAILGTPADSAMLGIHKIIQGKKPDLVLSGVNEGANLAEDILYSGTVGAAMEANSCGIRSIAFSQRISRNASHEERCDFTSAYWDCARTYTSQLIKELITWELPLNTVLNVNFPETSPKYVKGVAVTRQGQHLNSSELIEKKDPNNHPYYWIGHYPDSSQTGAPNTDLRLIQENYISVTPLQNDWTDHQSLADLQRKGREIKLS